MAKWKAHTWMSSSCAAVRWKAPTYTHPVRTANVHGGRLFRIARRTPYNAHFYCRGRRSLSMCLSIASEQAKGRLNRNGGPFVLGRRCMLDRLGDCATSSGADVERTIARSFSDSASEPGPHANTISFCTSDHVRGRRGDCWRNGLPMGNQAATSATIQPGSLSHRKGVRSQTDLGRREEAEDTQCKRCQTRHCACCRRVLSIMAYELMARIGLPRLPTCSLRATCPSASALRVLGPLRCVSFGPSFGPRFTVYDSRGLRWKPNGIEGIKQGRGDQTGARSVFTPYGHTVSTI
jgi:hypothetical protein